MSKFGTLCASLVVLGFIALPTTQLSAQEPDRPAPPAHGPDRPAAEQKSGHPATVVSVDLEKQQVTVYNAKFEGDGSTTVKAKNLPKGLKKGDAVLVTFAKEGSTIVLK